jgi:polysaccharide pyruvyl transferase WcaK-like protein
MIDKRAIELALSSDPDGTLLKYLEQELANGSTTLAPPPERGRPVRLLLSGYFGAGNVGSDMRSGEIVRQIRHLLGEGVRFSAMAVSTELAAGVYTGVDCLPTEIATPGFLTGTIGDHHGVIACEGSMFKSTFSDVLSGIMSASLGLASAQGKLAVGYGAEVGRMSDRLASFVRERTGEALILCRNKPSHDAARALGLRAEEGADTAWTFHASQASSIGRLLKEWGWNASDPILTVCPVNPFWWPVRANPRMALDFHKTGAHADLHYRSIFFHADSPEIRSRYRQYIEQMAIAVTRLARERDAFPLLVGMERVDEQACKDLSARLGLKHPPLMGYRHAVRDVIGILRFSSLLVSSRFHALVGAMPAAVPSIGISMDERINNLFGDPAQKGRVIPADAPDLGDRIVAAAARLEQDAVIAGARNTVVPAVEAIGQMGIAFMDEFKRKLPTVPIPTRPRNWQEHLPPLPREISDLLAM